MPMAVRGDNQAALLGGTRQRWRLSARRGAHIQNAIAGADAKQQWYRLRRLVLNRYPPGAELRRARGASSADAKRVAEQNSVPELQASLFERGEYVLPLRRIAQRATEARSPVVGVEQSDHPRLVDARKPAFDHPQRMRMQNRQALGVGHVGPKELPRPAISPARQCAAEPRSRAARRTLFALSSRARRTHSPPPTAESFAGTAVDTHPAAARAPPAGRADRPSFETKS